jgi:hypothetical protein
MTASEQAARLILGDLNEPETHIGTLLVALGGDARLSTGEQSLVDLAQQFWNGMGATTLGHAMRWLDTEGQKHLVEALQIKFGMASV